MKKIIKKENSMEENTKQQEETKQEGSNFSYTDPNTSNPENINIEEISKLTKELIVLPADTLSKIKTFLEDIINNKNINNYREYFRANAATAFAVDSRNTIARNSVYEEVVNKDKEGIANSVNYADKHLNIENIELSANDVNPKTAVARFTKYINAGEIVRVPLWHSGFWVTLRPPKQKDFIILEQEIANNHIQLGRDTNSLVYSNYSVIVTRIIATFINNHITEASIDIGENEDFFDYISIQDLNILILGILSSIFPKGLDYTKACRNNLQEEDGIKTCNAIIRATLDTKKLLFVNRQALTKDMLEHMAKRRSRSVSVDAVKEYQNKIASLAPKTIDVLDGKVTIEIENPTINKFVDVGERWVEALISESEALLTSDADISTKNNKIETLVLTIYLGIYNAYVKHIKTNDDGRIYKDQDSIDTMLDRLSEVEDTIKPFINGVSEYISNSAVAVVATPAYECPDCKKSDKLDYSSKYGFDNLIPLNMIYLFFALSALSKQNTLRLQNMYSM